MAVVQVLSGEGEGREVRLGPGDSLDLGPDTRVEMDLALGEVELAVTDSDALALSAGGETVYLTGLIEHLENEAGATLAFADGASIDSLGALLAALGGAGQGAADALSGMTDLIAEDGDVLFLALGAPQAEAGAAPAAPLDIGEVLDTGQVTPLEALAGAASAVDGNGGGSWADTEAAGFGGFATPLDGDDDGMIIPGDPSGLA